jgi:outer membrane immunogenic protein
VKFSRTGDDEVNGFVGGAHVGYNYQAGALVVGAEADWTWSDISVTEVEHDPFFGRDDNDLTQ